MQRHPRQPQERARPEPATRRHLPPLLGRCIPATMRHATDNTRQPSCNADSVCVTCGGHEIGGGTSTAEACSSCLCAKPVRWFACQPCRATVGVGRTASCARAARAEVRPICPRRRLSGCWQPLLAARCSCAPFGLPFLPAQLTRLRSGEIPHVRITPFFARDDPCVCGRAEDTCNEMSTDGRT